MNRMEIDERSVVTWRHDIWYVTCNKLHSTGFNFSCSFYVIRRGWLTEIALYDAMEQTAQSKPMGVTDSDKWKCEMCNSSVHT